MRSRKSAVAHRFSECLHKKGCAPAAHSEVVGDLLELSATFFSFLGRFPISLSADVLVLQDMTFV